MSGNSFFASKKWKGFMAKLYGFGAAVVIVGALFKIQHWPGAGLMLIVGLGTEAVIFMFSAFEPIHEEYDWTLVYPELAGMNEENKGKELEAGGDPLTNQLDKMLEEAKIGPDLLESLGQGMRNLSDSVSKIGELTDASVASQDFTANLNKATGNVDKLAEAYKSAEESVSTSVDQLANAYTRASRTLESFSVANDEANNYSEQLGKVSKNLSALNAAYELQLQGSNEHLKATNTLYEGIQTILGNLNESMDDTGRYRKEIGNLASNLEQLNTVYGNMLTAMNVRR